MTAIPDSFKIYTSNYIWGIGTPIVFITLDNSKDFLISERHIIIIGDKNEYFCYCICYKKLEGFSFSDENMIEMQLTACKAYINEKISEYCKSIPPPNPIIYGFPSYELREMPEAALFQMVISKFIDIGIINSLLMKTKCSSLQQKIQFTKEFSSNIRIEEIK